jgi:hypothetical protein
MKLQTHLPTIVTASVSGLFMLAYTALGQSFNYPEILRQPADQILTRFDNQRADILPYWWAMMVAALLFIPVSALVARRTGLRGDAYQLAVWAGGLAGLVQAVGLSRWVFLVPQLATDFQNPALRLATTQLFLVFHQWLGGGLGEWFGYLFTGLWTLLVVAAIAPRARILAAVGGASAIAVWAGLAEPFGVSGAGLVNAIGYSVWALWLVAVGFINFSSAVTE